MIFVNVCSRLELIRPATRLDLFKTSFLQLVEQATILMNATREATGILRTSKHMNPVESVLGCRLDRVKRNVRDLKYTSRGLALIRFRLALI